MERVFLSKKTVILGSVLYGKTPSDIAFSLSERLRQPVTVKNSRGISKVERSEVGHGVTSYGVLQLEDGKRGYILSLSVVGTSVTGMYFYREGETYLTEMVDPDRRRVHQVISGERI